MSPYFNGHERTAQLLYHAGLWRGTPWMANSDARGVGVSCHNLPRAIYMGCGALSSSFPRVIGDPAATKHSRDSKMVPFLDSRPEFIRVDLSAEPPVPGDLLGIRIYKCIDHLGVYLGQRNFVHVLMHKTTSFDPVHVPPWSERIEAAWRIVWDHQEKDTSNLSLSSQVLTT